MMMSDKISQLFSVFSSSACHHYANANDQKRFLQSGQVDWLLVLNHL